MYGLSLAGEAMGSQTKLFLISNVCCRYTLEAPQRGTSNKYPQYMFLWRNKENNVLVEKKKKIQELWIRYL